MKNIRRAQIVGFLLAFITLAGFADALQDFVNSPAINAPKAAVMVHDLKTGHVIASHNANLPLIPASIMKSVTTATLLEKTGADFRYSTRVFATGSIKNGVLNGNILVKASGDPSVNSAYVDPSPCIITEIVSAVKKMKIISITGRIMVDESNFPGAQQHPSWASGDLPHAYGTGSRGFNFEDNATGKKSVANPPAAFVSRLKSALQQVGISVEDASHEQMDTETHLLVDHHSVPIDEIMRSCMMRSDNQYAEALLRQVAVQNGFPGSTQNGADAETKFWSEKKANLNGVKIVDGSGLSRSNRVTASFMSDVLRTMSHNPYYASFFPLAGQEGTLRKFLAGTPLEGYIAMKTGSMNGIQCYAGYKLDDDYAPTHSVVIIMNEMKDRASARKQVEQMLLELFK